LNGFRTSSELNSLDAHLLSGKRGEEGGQIDAIDGVFPRKVLSIIVGRANVLPAHPNASERKRDNLL
jgi:hypothetical protein